MAVVQVDGASAVTSTSTNNNKGTIKQGGNVSNTSLWNTTDLGLQASLATQFNYISSGSDAGNDGPVAASSFNINLAQGVVRRYTTTITDIANTVLLGGDSYKTGISGVPYEGDNTINYASGIRNGSWNIYSGVFSPSLVVTADTFGADDAARVTRSQMGTYRFLVGTNTPTAGTYTAKTT